MNPVGRTQPIVNESAYTPNASLAFNLTHNQQVDLRIQQLGERRDRNYRQDLLRNSLSLKSSVTELQTLIETGRKQKSGTGTATAISSASMGLNTAPGEDLDKAIDQVAALSNIKTGNLLVNGTKINVDITTDSVNDIITRINNANLGVTASYDTGANKLQLTSSEDFTLGNGSSLFFQEMKVTTGPISNGAEDGRVNFYSSERFKGAMRRFISAFNKVMEFAGEDATEEDTTDTSLDLTNRQIDATDFVKAIKDAVTNAIKDTVNSSFAGSGRSRLSFGLSFSYDSGDFVKFDGNVFNDQLGERVDEMIDFFAKEMNPQISTSGGFFDQIFGAVDTYNKTLQGKISSYSKTGLLVDLEA